jgi:hypothetical protein
VVVVSHFGSSPRTPPPGPQTPRKKEYSTGWGGIFDWGNQLFISPEGNLFRRDMHVKKIKQDEPIPEFNDGMTQRSEIPSVLN